MNPADERMPATRPSRPPAPVAASAPEDMMLFVQSIKGATASVLLALAFAGRFMSHRELQLWTRCDKDQVTFALQALVRRGWAAGRTDRGPWVLIRALCVAGESQDSRANPLKGLSSSSDSLNLLSMGTLLLSPCSKEILTALYACGIREPTASELAQLPHMTIEYIQAHADAARAHGMRIGSAIESMRLGAPPLDRPSSGNRQAEVEEKIRRFKEGR